MGRSVSTPTGAVGTVFLHQEFEEQYEWDDFIDDVRRIVREKYPSFTDCDRWVDREDRAILENGHACVTVSEYCGVTAVCLVPKWEYQDLDAPELADAWCRQVEATWEVYIKSRYTTAMESIGTASNGETFYREAN